MTRNELLVSLRSIQATAEISKPRTNALIMQLGQLIDDVQDEGVLDVQCPNEVAVAMNLPRPA